MKENITIQHYEAQKYKFYSFKTDGVAAVVLLGIKEETKKCLPKKRKVDTEPSVALLNNDVSVGIDPGLK
jgi:hypothetical protein